MIAPTRGDAPDTTSLAAVDVYGLLIADVFALSGRLRRKGDEIARRHGETRARWQLLRVISQGSWTVPEVASRLGITRQAVQRIADDLVTDGRARYADNPAHRRSPLVHCTSAGHRILDALTNDARNTNEPIAELVTNEQLEQARRVLAGIKKGLDNQRRTAARGR